MGYADRFIIATTVSASAVAYYATPHELVTKLWIVPGALSAVLFPTFAAMTSGRAVDETAGPPAWALALLGVRWLFVVLVPVTLALALFAREALGWWIGAEFAIYSAPVLQLLALGILINCLAHVPLTLLQGSGQARAPALLQAVQILPYVALLWWLTQTHGVIAAAALWLARMVLDTLAMFWLCSRDHGGLRRWQPGRAAYFAGGLSLMAFAATLASLPLATRSVLWVATVVVVAALLAPWHHTVGWSKATRS
jgi:O-antigen/teichoic acid export membrane protein